MDFGGVGFALSETALKISNVLSRLYPSLSTEALFPHLIILIKEITYNSSLEQTIQLLNSDL